MPVKTNYYVQHKKRFLWEFDFVAKNAHSELGPYFGKNTDVLLSKTRREFEGLFTQLPDLGGQQPFTEFIVFTGMLLAIYQISKEQGKTPEQTGEVIYKIGKALINSLPTFLLLPLIPVNFSRRYVNLVKKRAVESHARQYPEGYVFNFVEGDGKTFDYGVDYIECASCKFLAKHDASEIAPYLCPADIHYSNDLEWGLNRTMTLAEGAPKCDFRFKRGGQTNVAVPESLKALVVL